MEPFGFDLSRWPRVVITVPAEIDADSARVGVERLRALLLSPTKVTVLVDSRNRASLPNAVMRRTWSELLRSLAPDLARSVTGWAVITRSPLLRAAYTAILWLAPPPCAAAFFTSIEQAHTFLDAASVQKRVA